MDSIWSKTCEREKCPALEEDIRAEVIVVGGGILRIWIS